MSPAMYRELQRQRLEEALVAALGPAGPRVEKVAYDSAGGCQVAVTLDRWPMNDQLAAIRRVSEEHGLSHARIILEGELLP